MTPRLFFPEVSAKTTGEELSLSRETARRLFRVLRMRAGESLGLFDGDGGEFAADIASLSPDAGTLRIVSRLPRPAADMGLVARVGQAICAPNKMDWAVEKMTELGALEIIPLQTTNSARGKTSPDRWRRLAAASCEQCGRATIPQIPSPTDFAEFTSRNFGDAQKIALSPRGDIPLSNLLSETNPRRPGVDLRRPEVDMRRSGVEPPTGTIHPRPEPEIVLLCGPESGLTPNEETAAVQSGFTLTTLGPRILRAETAALAALAIITELTRPAAPAAGRGIPPLQRRVNNGRAQARELNQTDAGASESCVPPLERRDE